MDCAPLLYEATANHSQQSIQATQICQAHSPSIDSVVARNCSREDSLKTYPIVTRTLAITATVTSKRVVVAILEQMILIQFEVVIRV